MTTAARTTRRRRWPWILLGVILVLAIVLVVAAEAVARTVVPGIVREKVVSSLSLPSDQDLDVEVGGIVVPQLLAGSLDDLILSGADVPLGDLAVDADVHLTGVPIRDGVAGGPGTATLRLDAGDLETLLAGADVPPVLAQAAIGLDEPDVRLSKEFSILGASVPVELSLTPGAASGDLTLAPTGARLGGASLSLDQIAAVLGTQLQPFPVCFADRVPAGLTLTDVSVSGAELVATVDLAPGLLTDPAQQELGTCG